MPAVVKPPDLCPYIALQAIVCRVTLSSGRLVDSQRESTYNSENHKGNHKKMGSFKSAVSAFTRIRQVCLLSLVAVSLSACSAIGLNAPWSHSRSSTPDQKLIAENLVN